MSNTEQMVSVQLIESILSNAAQGYFSKDHGDQLRALLSQPAAQHQGEPVAYIRQKDIDRLLSAHVAGCSANLEKEPRDGFVPFFAHPDAGEVERLRAEVEQFKLANARLSKENVDRRAQLAERDALLREADELMYIMTGHDSHARLADRYGEKWWDAIDNLRGRVNSAISASAEPSAPVERAEWMAVADRKPERDKVVLVAFDTHAGKSYTTAKLCQDGRAHTDCEAWYVHVSGGHQLKTVTHWWDFERAALERKP